MPILDDNDNPVTARQMAKLLIKARIETVDEFDYQGMTEKQRARVKDQEAKTCIMLNRILDRR